MTILLPLEPVPASQVNPKLLVLYWVPKCWKTTSVALLPKSLLIDLEDWSDYVSAMKVKAKSIVEIREILSAIQAANYPYDYIILDTLSALEELILPEAAKLYKNTVQWKSFPVTGDVRNLAHWAWYVWIRKAMLWVIKEINKYCKTLIIIWHVKEKNLTKEDTVVTANDLSVQWNLKTILASQTDWVGYIYRKWNKNIVTFKQHADSISWTRCTHLEGKEFVLSEKMEDGSIRVDWSWIFPYSLSRVTQENWEVIPDNEAIRSARIKILDSIRWGGDIDELKNNIWNSKKFNAQEIAYLLDFADENFIIFNNN